MNISPIDWHNLNDIEKNQMQFKIFTINKYKKIIEQVDNFATIYKLGSQYFCLDVKFRKVTYYMKYQVSNNGKLGDVVWQSLVWIDPGAPYIRGYPQNIFFNYLLPKFSTIITDSEQTWDGRRFWNWRIIDAFNMNLNVYFYDFANHKIVKMNNVDDFRQAQSIYDIWGNTNRHLMKRMLITNKELPIS